MNMLIDEFDSWDDMDKATALMKRDWLTSANFEFEDFKQNIIRKLKYIEAGAIIGSSIFTTWAETKASENIFNGENPK